ncbi:MBL fold metallo-hydrolase [Candidatus Poribacteria bacterium]|jgi:hydroxyacylglutathione hydrolase|nr:MBL fold metallo-hydrolase [Candidatus Poribacteria bacterium]MBT5532592.1 MBL fold metallo-hydrolase [Candidatus Poribacteria bacterium]MBT7097918.1 MBL fold metallo-hydrolase [Candidatus Poribacteria bacterium]MBT7805555.1 MBL fold metallo-hydrolase [Candidatus Poribacteria bacterium]
MPAIALEDEFGDIIGKARAGRGKSLSAVAAESGVSEADLRALESYERPPSEDEANAIAEAVGLDGPRLYAIATESWAPDEEPALVDPAADVIRLQNFVGGYPVFCYILVCRKTRSAAVVDTAADPDKVLQAVKSAGLKPQAILLTHGHADHVEGVEQVQKTLGVPVVLSEDMGVPAGVGEHFKLGEGDTYRIGDLDVRMLKTPGHSEGCCTFVTGGVAIMGDLIFAGSMGKPNYSFEASMSSVEKLFELPDSTRLYPGHGPSTTIGEEKAHNPFLA